MAIALGYIIDFLRRHENLPPDYSPIMRGYVPARKGVPIGQSGVTIATGCDLGQQTRDGLASAGLAGALLEKLSPYCGLRRADAQAALKAAPLEITPEQADQIDGAIISRYIADTAVVFDRTAQRVSDSPDWRLSDRPREVQAVAVDLAYQLGQAGYPATRAALARADYHAAIIELRDPAKWGGEYMTRRNAEADLLMAVAP